MFRSLEGAPYDWQHDDDSFWLYFRQAGGQQYYRLIHDVPQDRQEMMRLYCINLCARGSLGHVFAMHKAALDMREIAREIVPQTLLIAYSEIAVWVAEFDKLRADDGS